jgi:ATP-dependent RNA circularization protein (DNA/RNA ligase family)
MIFLFVFPESPLSTFDHHATLVACHVGGFNVRIVRYQGVVFRVSETIFHVINEER